MEELKTTMKDRECEVKIACDNCKKEVGQKEYNKCLEKKKQEGKFSLLCDNCEKEEQLTEMKHKSIKNQR
jgi:hypothetical protein